MTISFYTVALPRCRCGKPATCEVQGTGNAKYDTCCDACGKRRVRELTAAWSRESAEAQRRQVEATRG